METRQEREERAQWEARERAAYIEKIATAHPADLGPCSTCEGSGEVPFEWSARECPSCFGTGSEIDDGLLDMSECLGPDEGDAESGPPAIVAPCCPIHCPGAFPAFWSARS